MPPPPVHARDEFLLDLPQFGGLAQVTHQSRAKSDTLQEMKHYGLHRHFTGGTSVVMFGGGMKKGYIYGKTADERPNIAIENPVSVEDLHATILHLLGLHHEELFFERSGLKEKITFNFVPKIVEGILA